MALGAVLVLVLTTSATSGATSAAQTVYFESMDLCKYGRERVLSDIAAGLNVRVVGTCLPVIGAPPVPEKVPGKLPTHTGEQAAPPTALQKDPVNKKEPRRGNRSYI